MTYDTLPGTELFVKMDNELVCVEEEKELEKLIFDINDFTKDWDHTSLTEHGEIMAGVAYDYRVKVT